MAESEPEKTISLPADPVEPSTPGPDPGEKELTTASGTVSKHTLESVASSSSPSTVVADNEGLENGASALSRAITPRRGAVKVPRSRRRGLLGRFTLVAEIENPYDYGNSLKWFITFIVAFAAAAAPTGSSIFFPSLGQVAHDLTASPTITNLSIALYMLSMAIFPLWWSAFSEAFGRRSIYLLSFILFVLFGILSAVSKSIGMLVVMRMFSGGAAASVQAVGAGTIADLWDPKERGRAMGIFYLGPLCGPLFAPIIGGALAQRWNWRATLWFLVIYGGITWLFIVFALPETLRGRKGPGEKAAAEEVAVATTTRGASPTFSRTSTRERMQNKTKKYSRMARMVFLDPLKIVLWLRFPAVVLTVYYASVTFGSLYVLNVSIQDTFAKAPYNFSTLILGLLYIPNSLGYVLASIFGGRWMDFIMKREAIKAARIGEDGKLIYRPEDRMRENAWLGAILYPAAMLWYGWTAEKGVYWIVPIIANFFYGVGSMLIFAMATTMLTEFMPKQSSNGVAVNNFVRNVFSCVGAIVAAPVIKAIGNGWLFTILGLWALSSSLTIWAMRRFGPKWRERMERELG